MDVDVLCPGRSVKWEEDTASRRNSVLVTVEIQQQRECVWSREEHGLRIPVIVDVLAVLAVFLAGTGRKKPALVLPMW